MIGIKKLYIFWILHQTTTSDRIIKLFQRCISFESYIKPQHIFIKRLKIKVVYLLNPTSNHNCSSNRWGFAALYIFWILHQTTTRSRSCRWACRLYIFWILHQTTTECSHSCAVGKLYIFWILHQTTTLRGIFTLAISCISFESYIKPQLLARVQLNLSCCISFESYIKPQRTHVSLWDRIVVYLLNPTSNHNYQ